MSSAPTQRPHLPPAPTAACPSSNRSLPSFRPVAGRPPYGTPAEGGFSGTNLGHKGKRGCEAEPPRPNPVAVGDQCRRPNGGGAVPPEDPPGTPTGNPLRGFPRVVAVGAEDGVCPCSGLPAPARGVSSRLPTGTDQSRPARQARERAMSRAFAGPWPRRDRRARSVTVPDRPAGRSRGPILTPIGIPQRAPTRSPQKIKRTHRWPGLPPWQPPLVEATKAFDPPRRALRCAPRPWPDQPSSAPNRVPLLTLPAQLRQRPPRRKSLAGSLGAGRRPLRPLLGPGLPGPGPTAASPGFLLKGGERSRRPAHQSQP